MKKFAFITILAIAWGCGRDDNKQAESQQEAAQPHANVTAPTAAPKPTPIAISTAAPIKNDTKTGQSTGTPAPAPVTPTPVPPQGQPQGAIAGMINLDTLGNCVVANTIGATGLGCTLGVNNVTGAPEVAISLVSLQLTVSPICTFQSVGQNASRFTVTSLSPLNVSISPVKDGVNAANGYSYCNDPCGNCPVNPPATSFTGNVALFNCSLSN